MHRKLVYHDAVCLWAGFNKPGALMQNKLFKRRKDREVYTSDDVDIFNDDGFVRAEQGVGQKKGMAAA